MMLKALISITILLILAACSGSTARPEAQYYLLESEPKTMERVLPELLIQVRSINLPDYLKQSNLVLKLPDNTIEITHFHHWADNLADAIRKVIINDLNLLSSQYGFVRSCKGCDEIEISVEHFYPTAGGEALLSGYYILHLKGKRIQKYFSLSADLERNGYSEAVVQMRKLLSEMVEQIAQSLNDSEHAPS